MWGGLERRKGIDLLADALELGPPVPPVFVAGHPAPGFEAELEEAVARMRAVGAPVDLRLGRLPTDEGLRVLSTARCVVIPYRWHPGTSRVMSEGAAVGVPVVGPDYGLVGHYIRKYELGIAVDPEDPVALREAVLRLTEDSDAHSRYAPGLHRFIEEMVSDFGRTIRSAFGLA
jgi:glycosyltransferase involved in cell wall biosynthesis